MTGRSPSQLSAGEYRIEPSVASSDVSLGDLVSGDVEVPDADDDRLHRYDVVRPDGTAVLQVFETHGSADHGWLPFSLPQYVYQHVEPDGDPRFLVEVDQGLTPSYTVRDARSEDPLGSVAKSPPLVGNWQLTAPGAGTLATAERVRSSTSLSPASGTTVTWEVSGPDGATIAQFQRSPAEGSTSDRVSAMDVSCSQSQVSTEQCLAFAFALLYEGTKSTSHTQGGE